MRRQDKGIILMLISALATCTGQLMWKISSDNGLLSMVIGFILYGVGALLMIIAFRFGEVSVLQPMLSIGFVFSLLLAGIVLHESISLQKVAGVILIIAGMFFLSQGGKKEKQ